MITLFSTCKPFVGHTGIIQLNAIRSWFSNKFAPQIVLFGSYPELEALQKEYPIEIVAEYASFDGRIPLLNHMFEQASNMAKFETMCYVNADIILPESFFRTIELIQKKRLHNFLIAGQRYDIDISMPLQFNGDWETKIREQYSFILHNPLGSDYFIFPKGQYTTLNMPDMLVGRPGWDLWMIYHGFVNQWKTIDASEYMQVWHQNHDYLHKPKDATIREQDDQANYQYLPTQLKYLFQLNCCLYRLNKVGQMSKNYCNGNYNKYYYLRNNVGKTSLWTKLFIRTILFLRVS